MLRPERELDDFAMMERGLEEFEVDGGPIDCDVGGRLRGAAVRRVVMLISLKKNSDEKLVLL